MEGGPPCFPPGFTCPAVLWRRIAQAARLAYGALTLWRPASRPVRLARGFVTGRGPRGAPSCAPQPRRGSARALVSARRFGLAPVRSPLLGGSRVDFLSSGYLDVSVPPVAEPGAMRSRRAGTPSRPRFPHSETRGSQAVCASPRTIAACRVLLRLPVPRHPPCALATPAPPGAGRSDIAVLDPLMIQLRSLSSLCGSQGARGRAPRAGCRGESRPWRGGARRARRGARAASDCLASLRLPIAPDGAP